MSGKKVGSDGQVRNTTAGWAADTKTYPEGMRLMNTDTGAVRISKGTTYALAWAPSAGEVAWGTITGNLLDQGDLLAQFSAVDDDINTKADAAKVPTVLDVIVNVTTMTGVNQFGNTFTLTNPALGEFELTADAGTPFTANKTMASVTSGEDGIVCGAKYRSISEIGLRFFDTTGAPADPSADWFLFIRVYP